MALNLYTWWLRAGKGLALLGLAVLGLVDVGRGPILAFGGTLGLVAAFGQIALAMAAAAVWLLARRLGPARLIQAALGVAVWSLATTAAHVYLHDVDGRYRLWEAAEWGFAESCAMFGVLFALARWARPVPAMIGVFVAGLAVSAMPLRVVPGGLAVTLGLAMALLGAVAVASGMYFRLVANARERQLETVRAEQRAEFARDLHDFIAHHVTGIVVQAQGARYVAGTDPGRAAAALEQIEEAGLQTMAAMRRMVGMLRGQAAAPNAPLAVLADVPSLVDAFAAGAAKAHLQVDGELDDLPVDVSTSGYRVVMEALSNVRQHAQGAKRADVWISRQAAWLHIRVTNDGPTVHERRPMESGHDGWGLAGLAERVGAVGGRLRAEPVVGGGWVVDAALPLGSKK